MNKLSFKIAYCGIITAFCLIAMFCTGIIPFSMYLMPVIASVLLLFIKEELGSKWAWLSFIATALLSFVLSPDWEAKLMFTAVLGWYPLVREKLTQIKPKILSFVVRILILNAETFAVYFVLVRLFGMNEFIDTGGMSVFVFVAITLIVSEMFFVIYDLMVGRLALYYKYRLSKKLHSKIK